MTAEEGKGGILRPAYRELCPNVRTATGFNEAEGRWGVTAGRGTISHSCAHLPPQGGTFGLQRGGCRRKQPAGLPLPSVSPFPLEEMFDLLQGVSKVTSDGNVNT